MTGPREVNADISDVLGHTDRFFDAVERGDRAAILDCYAEDAVIWHNFTGMTQTRDENVALLMCLPAIGKVKYVQVERVVNGDFVAQRHVLDLTDRQGMVHHVPAAIFLHIKNGRIDQLNEYVDSVHLTQGPLGEMLAEQMPA